MVERCESTAWPKRPQANTVVIRDHVDAGGFTLYVNLHKCVTMRNGGCHAIEMTSTSATFGQTIARARKGKAMSQKDLAGLILKEEDGAAISPQYLNDIEHDRRSPTSDHLIRQFAAALKLSEDMLFFLAGKIPDDVRHAVKDPVKAGEAFMNFRKAIARK